MRERAGGEMSAAFRRLPRLVCGAVRARAALSGLRPAVSAASWGEESINRGVGRGRHFFPGYSCNRMCLFILSALSSFSFRPFCSVFLFEKIDIFPLVKTPYFCNPPSLISQVIKDIIPMHSPNLLPRQPLPRRQPRGPKVAWLP